MLLFVFFVCLVCGVFVLPFLTVCETFDILILDTVIASSKTKRVGNENGGCTEYYQDDDDDVDVVAAVAAKAISGLRGNDRQYMSFLGATLRTKCNLLVVRSTLEPIT